MKQLGNLAIICAKRQDVTLSLSKGTARVSIEGTDRVLNAPWDADDKIEMIIHELNFGNYSNKRMEAVV